MNSGARRLGRPYQASHARLVSSSPLIIAFYAYIVSGSSAGIQATEIRLHPTERTFTMGDLIRWSADGTLLEESCAGPAAIVASICRIGFEGRNVLPPGHPEDELGPML